MRAHVDSRARAQVRLSSRLTCVRNVHISRVVIGNVVFAGTMGQDYLFFWEHYYFKWKLIKKKRAMHYIHKDRERCSEFPTLYYFYLLLFQN